MVLAQLQKKKKVKKISSKKRKKIKNKAIITICNKMFIDL